jgi:hypothetical protein
MSHWEEQAVREAHKNRDLERRVQELEGMLETEADRLQYDRERVDEADARVLELEVLAMRVRYWADRRSTREWAEVGFLARSALKAAGK